MPNKIISIFLIIFSLIIFIANSDDQINFDVSEIQVLDEGNKIIGKDRGTITTSSGIVIDADEFEFNKVKNILKAKGNIIIKDKINNYNFKSYNILYDKNNEKIEIIGKSEAFIDQNYEFKTDDVTILRKEMIISSEKGAKILDTTNQTRYEIGKFSYSLNEKILKGEKIFINTNYNQPFIYKYFFDSSVLNIKNRKYIAKDININLKKDIFGNKDNDPRFKGLSSSFENGITTINKGIFTTCKKNDKCPPWSIQADKVIYNKDKKQVLYNNALVKVYDIPVFYFPKFSSWAQ